LYFQVRFQLAIPRGLAAGIGAGREEQFIARFRVLWALLQKSKNKLSDFFKSRFLHYFLKSLFVKNQFLQQSQNRTILGLTDKDLC